MVKFNLLVLTDGRQECLSRTIGSAIRNLPAPYTAVIVDDSASGDHHEWLLDEIVPSMAEAWGTTVAAIPPTPEKRGFAGAIQEGWGCFTLFEGVEDLDAPYIFHLEDDFMMNEPIDIESMAGILDMDGNLVQVALKRQPVSQPEIDAGGFMQMNPDAYDKVVCPYGAYVQHREFFTTNPCLYRSSLIQKGWPNGPQSEATFSGRLFVNPYNRAAYLGTIDGEPKVTHIGETRTGHGY